MIGEGEEMKKAEKVPKLIKNKNWKKNQKVWNYTSMLRKFVENLYIIPLVLDLHAHLSERI